MNQEEIDFVHFKDNQLANVDFSTGEIDVQVRTKKKGVFKQYLDVGSVNQDGYIRVWCNKRLRMKHRLLFWLYHGYLPVEVDHNNSVRSDNSINNLIASNRQHNTVGKSERSFKQLTEVEVRELCVEIIKGDVNITALSKQFGRSRCQIKGILTKKYWKEITDQYF